MATTDPKEELELLAKAFRECLENGNETAVKTCKGIVTFRKRRKAVEVEIKKRSGICYEIWGM